MFREMTLTFHIGEWDTPIQVAYSMEWDDYSKTCRIEDYAIQSPKTNNDLPAWMCKVLEKHYDICSIIWDHWDEETRNY